MLALIQNLIHADVVVKNVFLIVISLHLNCCKLATHTELKVTLGLFEIRKICHMNLGVGTLISQN
jgi:hypothetical protein